MPHTNSRETAINTISEYSDLTQREAEVYVHRRLDEFSRKEVANQLGIKPSTVDTHYQRAQPKATLPNIDTVENIPENETDSEEGEAWEIYFENGAMLRYVWTEKDDDIRMETASADPAQSFQSSVSLQLDRNELHRATLSGIEDYTKSYRDFPYQCMQAQIHIFEAITSFRPASYSP